MSRPVGWRRLATQDQRPKATRYPWESLEIGGSFFVWNFDSARAAARTASARLDREFDLTPTRETINGLAYNGARVTRTR